MIIAGAGGHAAEVLGILQQAKYAGTIYFFDDTKNTPASKILNQYAVLTSIAAAAAIFATDSSFVIGTGKPALRTLLAGKMLEAGGELQSVISPYAHIGTEEVVLEQGLNIMTGAVITTRTRIGRGSLLHIHCSVHHDTVLGQFCELSPGCRILGNVHIGSFVSVGAGAVILPGIHIGDHAIIGAGAVVTKDVPPGITVAGVPAHPLS